MENENNTNLPTNTQSQPQQVLSPRELVEKTFIQNGFPNENPDDLDAITEILQIWMDQGISNSDDYDYTAEQYVLLNDPDVISVLNQCRQYYEPKRRLSSGELTRILEDIAAGRLTRQDYDFKNGEIVTIEPTFNERLTAIKLLKEQENSHAHTQAAIQFVNNITVPDTPLQPANLNAPDAPPPDHYSLNLTEEGASPDDE